MNKTLKAADEVKKLHRMFQSLGEVVEVLDRIGSLEQAENEAQARIQKLNQEALQITAASELARAESERILAEAKTFAEGLKAEAEKIVEQAHADGKASLDLVTKECEKVITEAKAKAETAEGKAQACAIDVEVKTKELAELEAKIAKAQAQINKILGG